MTAITVKNIPDDLYELLKAQAKTNRRSINNEIIMLIERSVRSYRIDPEEVIARARELRELTAKYPITDEELDEAINQGRP